MKAKYPDSVISVGEACPVLPLRVHESVSKIIENSSLKSNILLHKQTINGGTFLFHHMGVSFFLGLILMILATYPRLLYD